MGTLSPILVRQSVEPLPLAWADHRCGAGLETGPRPEPLDYSSPRVVSQAWDDNCNQKRVARTALVLVLRSG